MSNQLIGIVIGGTIPAVFQFFQKFGSKEGVTPGAF